MSKFGRFFRTKMRHYVILRNKIEKKLVETLRMYSVVQDKTPSEEMMILLTEYLLEVNEVIVWSLKQGAITCALHNLRLAQEIVHKIFVLYHNPKLAAKAKISPSEVRKKMEKLGFPGWGEFYAQLSDVTHHNKEFVEKVYPLISQSSSISEDSKMFVEYYFMILHVLNLKVLGVLYNGLAPRMGGDYKVLKINFEALESVVQSDWDRVHLKQSKRLHDLIGCA